MKSIKLIINAIYIAIALSTGASSAFAETPVMFCAQDTRVCPNGAIVGRNPSNGCAFDACLATAPIFTKPIFTAPLTPLPPTPITGGLFCPADAMLCGNGSSVGRDPDNGCAFKACPILSVKPLPPTPITGGLFCPADAMLCGNGSSVGRDPDNGCAFKACPILSGKPKKGDYDSSCTTAIDLVNNLRIRSADWNLNGEVTKLQKFLYEKKFLKIAPTGFFGSMTKAAVIKFQISVGLDSTGYVGPYTREAIKAINVCDDESVSDTVFTTY